MLEGCAYFLDFQPVPTRGHQMTRHLLNLNGLCHELAAACNRSRSLELSVGRVVLGCWLSVVCL